MAKTWDSERIARKKQVLIDLFQKLIPYRDMAEGFLEIVKSDLADEDTLNWIVWFVTKSIDKVKWKSQRDAFERAIMQIQNIKKLEEKEVWSSDEDLLNNI